MTIEQLKKGDLFRLKPNGKTLVKGDYIREEKKYEFSYYDDINHFGLKKKGTEVLTDWPTND